MEILEKKMTWQKKELAGKLEVETGQQLYCFAANLENIEIILSADARLELFLFLEHGWIGQKNMTIKLAGERAEVKINMIILGEDKKAFQLNSVCEHLAKATVSSFNLKGVMFGQSELNFSGDIMIPGEGQLSDANLRCQTLLMSREAHARTVPSLEIIANDVKAAHAASIGKVDEELMFYLECRGFDRLLAQRLLVEGFLQEMMMNLSDEELREEIWQKIIKKLN